MLQKSLKIIGVIPARYDSTRFPGKALADILGKPMIQHVYERVKSAALLNDLIVATDDKRIMEAVKKFNGKAVLTGKHDSGTDRIAEAVKKLDVDIIANIQGDEPLIEPAMVEQVVSPFLSDSSIAMSTLVSEITDASDLCNQNIVKVVTDNKDFAVYFSRSPIPFPRDNMENSNTCKPVASFLKHIGIYAYTKEFLLKFTSLPQGQLEKTEKLEQLRAIENGYRIKVIKTKFDSIPVDIPEDINKVKDFLRKK